jgi:hypothetical protein
MWSSASGHKICTFNLGEKGRCGSLKSGEKGRCGSLKSGVHCIQIYPHPPKYIRTHIKPLKFQNVIIKNKHQKYLKELSSGDRDLHLQ